MKNTISLFFKHTSLHLAILFFGVSVVTAVPAGAIDDPDVNEPDLTSANYLESVGATTTINVAPDVLAPTDLNIETIKVIAPLPAPNDGSDERLILDVSFSMAADRTGDNLTVGGVIGVDYTFTTTTGELLLTLDAGGAFAPADIENILEAIRYRNNATTNTNDGERTFTFSYINDVLEESTEPAVSTITVDRSSEDPDVNEPDVASANIAVDAVAATAVNPFEDSVAPTATDIETIKIVTALPVANDGANEIITLDVNVPLNADATAPGVTVGGITIDYAYTIADNTLLITASPAANFAPADVEAILEAITYTNNETADTNDGDRTFTVTYIDAVDNESTTAAVSTVTVERSAPENPDVNEPDVASADYAETISDAQTTNFFPDAVAPTATNIETIKVVATLPGTNDGTDERLIADVSFSMVLDRTGTGVTVGGVTVDYAYTAGTGEFLVTKNGGGNFTGAEVEAVVEALRYRNNQALDATDGDRTFALTYIDDAAEESVTPAVSTITVERQSNPDLNVTDTTTVNAETSIGASTPADLATDAAAPNDDNIETLKIVIAGVLDGAAEEVILDTNVSLDADSTATGVTVGGVIVDYAYTTADGTLLITANPAANFIAADIKAILEAIQYQNTETDPTNDGDRTLTVTFINDAAEESNPAATTVTVDRLAPEDADLNDSDTTTTDTEAGAEAGDNVNIAEDATAPAATDIETVTVTVGGVLDGAEEVLTLDVDVPLDADATADNVTVGGVTGIDYTYTAATGVLEITADAGGAIAPTDIEAILEAITYINNETDSANDGNRTFEVTYTDSVGAESNTPAVATITVQRSVDNPDLNEPDTATTDTSSTTAAQTATNVAADIAEPIVTNIESIKVVVDGILDGAEEVITLDVDVPLDADATADNVTVGGVTGIDYTYTAATGVLEITADAGGAIAPTDIEAILEAITYINNETDSANDGNRTFTVTYVDATGAESPTPGVSTIEVDRVDVDVTITAPTTTGEGPINDITFEIENPTGLEITTITVSGANFDLTQCTPSTLPSTDTTITCPADSIVVTDSGTVTVSATVDGVEYTDTQDFVVQESSVVTFASPVTTAADTIPVEFTVSNQNGIDAANIDVSTSTAGTQNLVCTQISSTEVNCTVEVTSTGSLVIVSTDDTNASSTKVQKYFIGADTVNTLPKGSATSRYIISLCDDNSKQCKSMFPTRDNSIGGLDTAYNAFLKCVDSAASKSGYECAYQWAEAKGLKRCGSNSDCGGTSFITSQTNNKIVTGQNRWYRSRYGNVGNFKTIPNNQLPNVINTTPEQIQIDSKTSIKLNRIENNISQLEVFPLTGKVPAWLREKYNAESIFMNDSADSPYYEAAVNLYRQGVISGYGEQGNNASLQNPFVRAEMTKVIAYAQEITLEHGNTSQFTDVSPSDWFFPYAESLKNNDIITGNQLAPGEIVTLGEMAIILGRSFDFPQNVQALNKRNLLHPNLKGESARYQLNRGEALDIVSRTLWMVDRNANQYEDVISIGIPSVGINNLPASQTVMTDASVWLDDLTNTGAGHYYDPSRDQFIVFAHSSIWPADPTPYGPVFKPLIGGLQNGEIMTLKRNGVTTQYEVFYSELISPEEVDRLSDDFIGPADLVVFTCGVDFDNERWIIKAREIK